MSCFTWITCEESSSPRLLAVPLAALREVTARLWPAAETPGGERFCAGRAGQARPRCRFTGPGPSPPILVPPRPGRAAAGTPRLRLVRVAAHPRCPGAAISHPRRCRPGSGSAPPGTRAALRARAAALRESGREPGASPGLRQPRALSTRPEAPGPKFGPCPAVPAPLSKAAQPCDGHYLKISQLPLSVQTTHRITPDC